MSYRIEYIHTKDRTKVIGTISCSILTALFFLLFILFTCRFWSEGREVLRLLLIPVDPQITIDAAETFASELNCGINIKSAAADFFKTIIEYEVPY